jgi:hypothetical protein
MRTFKACRPWTCFIGFLSIKEQYLFTCSSVFTNKRLRNISIVKGWLHLNSSFLQLSHRAQDFIQYVLHISGQTEHSRPFSWLVIYSFPTLLCFFLLYPWPHTTKYRCTEIYGQCKQKNRITNVAADLILEKIFNFILTSWSTIHLEKLKVVLAVTKFFAYYRTQRFITIFTWATKWTLSWDSWIQTQSYNQFLQDLFSLLFFHLSLVS